MIDYHRALIVGLVLAASRSNSQTLAADGCPENQCRDPEGTCAGEVNCFADPCQVQQEPCSEDEVCTANYCGGCHSVCEPVKLTNQQVTVTTSQNNLSIESPQESDDKNMEISLELTVAMEGMKIMPSELPSYPPSLSAHPSHHPSVKGSFEPSESPSFSPSTSAGPSALRNESIHACQCDKSEKCVEEPLIPSSPKVRICLLSQPNMYIFKKNDVAVYVALIQQGVFNHPIIQEEIKPSSLRRRLIETTVPDYFFANPSENLKVNGFGILLQTGSNISREVGFSITITLLSEPSEAPSASPSTSSKPTFKGPIVRPTQSHEPSLNPSKSMTPTEEQTIGLTWCPCDIQNVCLQEPVTLTFTDRSIRVCLIASPSIAELTVPYVQVTNNPAVFLETQLDENIGVVTGNLSEEFFYVGLLDDVKILGIVDIFVQQGKKRAEERFSVQYKLESLTTSPTDTLSISAAPIVVPPLGIQACQCNNKNICVDDAVQSYTATKVRICIRSTPVESEIIQIDSLFFEMKENQQSAPLKTQSTIRNDNALISSSMLPGSSKRFRIIESDLEKGFFRDDSSLFSLRARGFATVKAESKDDDALDTTTTTTAIFEVGLQIVDEPTDTPSLYPSIGPTPPRSASPTNVPTGQPTQLPTVPPSQSPTQLPTDLPTQPPTVPSSQSPIQLPTESNPQPSAASGLSTSQPTKTSGSSTSQPTEASGSPSTQPSVASGSSKSQPSEASGFSSPQFSGKSVTSSGKRPASNYFSLCTCILLAFAFGFVG